MSTCITMRLDTMLPLYRSGSTEVALPKWPIEHGSIERAFDITISLLGDPHDNATGPALSKGPLREQDHPKLQPVFPHQRPVQVPDRLLVLSDLGDPADGHHPVAHPPEPVARP